jgi:hypothetical protein
MTNIDSEFRTKSEYDSINTNNTISTSVSSVSTREILSPEVPTLVMPTIKIPEPFRIDAKPFINRPFFVEEVKWDVNDEKYSLIETEFYRLPRDIIRSNVTLLNGMKIGSMYRADCELNISSAGTITHAGTVLVGVIPPLFTFIIFNYFYFFLINIILSGPHGFLHANEATSLKLKVPWYCNTDVDSLDMQLPDATYENPVSINQNSGNMATLVFLVLNPLQPSEGSSNSLSIIVEANFKYLDILVPTPRYVQYEPQSYFMNLGTNLLDGAAKYAKTIVGDGIDGLRSFVRTYTGLHNPNVPMIHQADLLLKRNRLNNVDTTQFIENLDPYANDVRIVQEPIFHSLEDEMSTNFIQKKRQYIGCFRVSQDDPVGLRLFNRPISPFQGGHQGSGGPGKYSGANNIELLHKLSRAWKGDIKITIQSVMNNKQQVKLRLIQMYNPSVKVAFGYPTYRSVLQAPSHLIEFTAGGQEHEIILPFLARNEMINCSRDNSTEALLHGEYYIYLAQPLANSSGSPKDIFFNVYITLEDNFNFYGYSTEAFTTGPPISLDYAPPDRKFVAQSMEVMNEEQKQEGNEVGKLIPSDNTRLQPILDMRSIMRRLYVSDAIAVAIPEGERKTYVFKIGQLYGESNFGLNNCQTPLRHVASMYYGKHAGTKFRMALNLTTGPVQQVSVKISYAPPQYNATMLTSNYAALLAGNPNGSQKPYNQLSIQQFPLNNVNLPVETADSSVFEFCVPNNSMMKFVGGPNKMTIGIGDSIKPYLAVEDFGNIVIDVFAEKEIKGQIIIEAAATDESRFGFHSIAPVFTSIIDNLRTVTPCVGDLASSSFLPVSTLNAFLYYTRN